jgi:hypothetical protein
MKNYRSLVNVVTVAGCSPALSVRSAGGKAIACQLMEHRYRLKTSGRHLRDPIDQSDGSGDRLNVDKYQFVFSCLSAPPAAQTRTVSAGVL